MSIVDLLFPPREDELLLRSLTDDSLLSFSRPSRVPLTRPACIVLLPFSNQHVRAALHEAKYHGSSRAFRLLGKTLSTFICDTYEGDADRSLTLVPLPLGQKRRRERGYNQVEEVIRVALRLTHSLPLRLDTTILTRTRETQTQINLPREKREANVRGAFSATHPADPTTTYLLIDDVLTTGATLQAAMTALTAAGARDGIPLALAH